MTASNLSPLALLLFASLCSSAPEAAPHTKAYALPASARQSPQQPTPQQQRRQPTTQSQPQPPRSARRSGEDELTRHLTAAETFQLSGDMARAAVENRAVVAVALQRLGTIAIREGQFERAVRLLTDSVAARDDARARTDLAIAHMRLLATDRAVEEARAALKLDERHARAHHVLGKLLYMKGDYAAARSALERAVVLDSDLDAAYTLGMSYLRLKDTGRARLLFEEMQAALDNTAAAHILFGRAYQETGFAADAEREFRRALKVDANAPRAHFYLGYLIMLHGASDRLPEASAEFERELALRPQDFYSHFFLGVLASTVENNHAKALRHLSEAVRLDPAQGEAYLYLGQSQVETGDAAGAERSLRRAIELTPDASQNSYQIKKAHFLLGRVLLKAGRRAEAERSLALARELQGQSLESSRQAISEILGQVKDTAKGASAPSQVAASNSRSGAGAQQNGGRRRGDDTGDAGNSGDTGGNADDAGGEDVLLIEESALDARAASNYKRLKAQLGEVLAQSFHNLGVIAAQQNRFAESAEQFAAAAAWKPDLAGLDRNWGIVNFRAAQYDKAIAPLARHVAAHPDDALARRMLGVSFYLTRNFEQSARTLKPLAPGITSDPELAYTYGVALVQLADHAQAAALFARLSDEHARSPEARLYAAQGFMMIEDYERALKEFRAVAALAPATRQAHYHAGQSLIRLNRLAEAEQEFRQELLLNPSDEASKYHLAYALLEQKRGTTEALTLLREAVAARPDYADARYQLGKALIEQGDAREAVEHLERAARIDPAKDYIQYQLSIAYRRAARPADAERALQLYRELKASSRTRERPAANAGAQPDVP